MSRRYLNEVRLGEPLKSDVRTIMHDVADRFGVRGAVRQRPVPHITLFGPYHCNQGHAAKARTQRVLTEFDTVPFRIDGFDHFDQETIYANVVPSPELRQLRQDLARELRPIASGYPDYDEDRYYQFHITVAFKDVGDQFKEIHEYVTRQYDLQRECYAKRVTALSGRSMMWEWDLPRGEELRQQEATSRESWQATDEALEELKRREDHRFEDPKPKHAGWLRQKISGLF